MKLQAIENVPVGKQQTRRKAPKIAPLLALAVLFLTVISVYCPLLQYTHKHFFQSLDNVIRPPPLLVPLLHTHLQHEEGPPPPLPNPANTNPDVVAAQVVTIPRASTTSEPKQQRPTRNVEGLFTSTPSQPRNSHRNYPVSLQHRSDEKKAVLASPSTPTQPSAVIQQFARNVKGLPGPVTPGRTNSVGTEHNGDKKISVIERQSRTATRNARGLSSSATLRDKHSVNGAHRKGKKKTGTKKPSNLVIQQPAGNVSSAMPRDKHLVGFQEKRDGNLVIQQPTSNVTALSSRHEDLVMNTNTFISSSGDVKVQGSAKPHEDMVMNTNPTTNTPISSSGELMLTPRMQESRGKCDIFCGEWVPNMEAPYYTNQTCWAIQDHQNCMKYERPDTQFMKWRWKPDGCELSIFDPIQFLELVRGKSLAFVGDSVARNHMQSLICLLSKLEYPIDVSEAPDRQTKRYEYKSYNFTVAMFWSPYLVRTTDRNDTVETRPFNLFLDEFNEEWTAHIEGFDYVIISAGHWFFRPTMFFLEGRVAGCLYCLEPNLTQLTAHFSYRQAFKTAFRAINSLKKYKGITYLRTFAPSHFENGPYYNGGNCPRTVPYRRNETALEEYNLEFYKIQAEELRIAEEVGKKRGLKFRLFDVTKAMWLRPDGHPNGYGHARSSNASMYNDCVHWCLPGPIDTWNDFLLELLKMDTKS